MRTYPWSQTTSDRQRRTLAVSLLGRKKRPSKRLLKLLGVNRKDYEAMWDAAKSPPATAPASPSPAETRASFLIDTGEFRQFGTSGIYTCSLVTNSLPTCLDLSHPSALRELSRKMFESENPEDNATLMIRSTSTMFKTGSCGWMVLGDIPPQAVTLLRMLLPSSRWSHVCWDRPFDLATPSASLASLCKLHNDLSRHGEDCEKTSRAITAMVSHVLDMRNKPAKGARIRSSKADDLNRFAPSSHWADIAALIEEFQMKHADVSDDLLARLITPNGNSPLLACGALPVEDFSWEQLRSLAGIAKPDFKTPEETYRKFKELRSLSSQDAVEALPGKEFPDQMREVLHELARESEKNEKSAQRNQKTRHQLSDFLVELGKVLGGGLALESRHAASVATRLRFVVVHRRTPALPAVSKPRFALPPAPATHTTITVDLKNFFVAIQAASTSAGLERTIGNLRQRATLLAGGVPPVTKQPPLGSLAPKTAVLSLAKVFPPPVLINALADYLPEGISRIVSDIIQTIRASDKKLSPKFKAWLQSNLPLAQERAAPLMAEAFLHLALKHMQSPHDQNLSDVSLKIDLEDFTRFIATLAKQLTTRTTPRDSQPQMPPVESFDEKPKSQIEEAPDTTEINDIVRRTIQEVTNNTMTPGEAAEELALLLADHPGDARFLAEEFRGQLREMETDPSCPEYEQKAAQDILRVLNKLLA